MKYLSTFSGIGGFELGIQKAYESKISVWNGKTEVAKTTTIQSSVEPATKSSRHNRNSSSIKFRGNTREVSCIGYSEIDKYAIQIYQKHFPQHKNYGDITTINATELPDFDLLVGGFPCQAFSIAGKRGGFDDTRGTLFFDIARILKEKQPRNFILENVKGLLSHDSGRTFKTIITTLAELGYCVEWQVLNAKNFGVPQNRERVFIVGHLGGIPSRKVFPIINDTREIIKTNKRKRITTGRTRNFGSSGQYHKLDEICSTLTTSMGTGGNNVPMVDEGIRIRRLTPLECERLMGYPDGWTEGLSDTQRYKTLGNGIVSNVVEEVVKGLLNKEE